jgi:hypothetical protein
MPFTLVALIATLVGASTYVYAKSKNATSGTAAVAGVAGGAGTAVVASILGAMIPVLLVLGAIALPAAGAYLYFNKDKQKALGPARDDW